MHVAFFAERVGLTAAQVAATCAPEVEAEAFPERERLLIRLVDALHDEARVDDGALGRRCARSGAEAQLIELIALAGFYHLISFVTNALRIPLEPYGARFPRRDGPDAAGDGCSRPASPAAGG